MIRSLIEPVHSILDLLGEVTGRKIRFVHKPELKSLARIPMSGAPEAPLVLFYRNEDNPLINHVIANECGHLIRLFRASEGRRRVAVANDSTRVRYREEIRDDLQRLSLIHGLDALRNFIPLWYEAVVFQVTRMPTDIMVERWIYDEYASMRDIQLAALQEQHERADSVLSRNIRRMTPGKIYDVSQIMNFVFFKLMGDLLGTPLVMRFERSRYMLEGEGLATWTAEHCSSDHEGDVSVIDHWAHYLQLSEWFEWRRFDAVSRDYLH